MYVFVCQCMNEGFHKIQYKPKTFYLTNDFKVFKQFMYINIVVYTETDL